MSEKYEELLYWKEWRTCTRVHCGKKYKSGSKRFCGKCFRAKLKRLA